MNIILECLFSDIVCLFTPGHADIKISSGQKNVYAILYTNSNIFFVWSLLVSLSDFITQQKKFYGNLHKSGMKENKIKKRKNERKKERRKYYILNKDFCRKQNTWKIHRNVGSFVIVICTSTKLEYNEDVYTFNSYKES